MHKQSKHYVLMMVKLLFPWENLIVLHNLLQFLDLMKKSVEKQDFSV